MFNSKWHFISESFAFNILIFFELGDRGEGEERGEGMRAEERRGEMVSVFHTICNKNNFT